MVKNVKYVDPKACPPLAPSLELYPQALPFHQKDLKMCFMVQRPLMDALETEYVVVDEDPPQTLCSQYIHQEQSPHPSWSWKELQPSCLLGSPCWYCRVSP